jgi:Dolichyl-phosphate-mannose-protein mannosyltransferase/Alg9-like mannosyltransferase family
MPPGATSPLQDSTTSPEIAERPVPGLSGTRLLLLALTLALVTCALLQGIHKGEFSENVDETVHASTGLYIASFLHDLPLRHPVQYTYRYYAQYPSLGIVMYPPAFYAVEGITFLLFGPSVVTARLTIILFALLGSFFWFRLVDELEDEYTAALSTVLLAFMPSVLNYEKTVMLDIPLMSFCIAASYFWVVYLRRGLPRHLYWFAAFLSLAFLTKHHAIYLLLWCPITLIAQKKWDRILKWRVVVVGAVSFVVVAPVYILQILMNASLALDVQGTSANMGMGWSYYWLKLPELIGWDAVVLSAAGIVIYLWRGKRDNSVIMLSWILACYIVFTLIRHKEARYIIYWVPAFAYFAVAPFTRKSSVSWVRVAGVIVVAAVLVSYTTRAWSYQRLYVSGYAQAAQQLTKSQGGCVLVDMDLPGNFIFFMRAYDPARRFVILRKALYDVRTVREWGVTEFAHNSSDVERILKDDSVRYVVVEQNKPLYFASQTALRDILNHSGEYKMVGTFPIESNMRGWQGRNLVLYESTAPILPAHGMLHIKMQNLHHDIEIPFQHLTNQ